MRVLHEDLSFYDCDYNETDLEFIWVCHLKLKIYYLNFLQFEYGFHM